MKNFEVKHPDGISTIKIWFRRQARAFSCMCLTVCDLLPNSKAGQNLEYQLSKSCTAPALIYGEAQAAESRPDFIHKMKMVLKEIKEPRINLKIIQTKPVIIHESVNIAFNESTELMAIFIASIETAKAKTRLQK